MFDLRLAFYEWQLGRAIRRHGWTGVPVGDHADVPSWVYSVGFSTSLGAPEILIFDIPLADANPTFWQAYRELLSGDLVLNDGQAWIEEGNIRTVWREMHPARRAEGWVAIADRWASKNGRPAPSVFQLVLPDPSGALPWDPSYQEDLRPRQPELYLPPEPQEVAAGAAL